MTLSVEKCCCGCSLRTGTIIIAVYILTCSIILTIFGSVVLWFVTKHYDTDDFDESVIDQDRNEKLVTGMKMALVSAVVGGAIQVILNILLLVGVKKENTRLVFTWIVAYVIFFGLSILALMTSFFQFPTNPSYQVATVINIGLSLYFLLVVRSYHRSLKIGRPTQQNPGLVYDVEKDGNLKRVHQK